MSRQYAAPVLFKAAGTQCTSLKPIGLQAGPSSISEADVQALVHAHPECLPISEIDNLYANPVAICRELSTPAGPIDNLMVTPSGLLVIVECKLWRNPQGRREVVGQILDYAKELSRWSSADLQREVRRRLAWQTPQDPIVELLRRAGHAIDEIAFNDHLTANLRRGRFLLLIVGDGIREGVEAIAEYLQAHAGLHFSIGLVELPFFELPDGSRLATPRVVARSTNIVRTVVSMPDGFRVSESDGVTPESDEEEDPDAAARAEDRQAFWRQFLDGLRLDDPEQSKPRPPRQGYVAFSMPAPNGTCWLTVYRELKTNEVGVFLSSTRGSVGERAALEIANNWDEIRDALGGSCSLKTDSYGRPRLIDKHAVASLSNEAERQRAFKWLGERVNRFVNVLRPRIRAIVAEDQGG